MPRKVRDLRRDLRRAGYNQVKGGKGSHTKWKHPLVPGSVIVPGYEEAVQKGHEMLEFMIESALEEGETLPQPHIYASVAH